MTGECKFMPGDYTFASGGNRNCHTILSFQPHSTGKSIIHWEPGRRRRRRGYFQMTRHTFSFQSPVFTKNIPVIHFHHNLPVSMFSVRPATDATHRRGIQISSCLFILSPMPFPEPHVSKSAPKGSYSELKCGVRVYPRHFASGRQIVDSSLNQLVTSQVGKCPRTGPPNHEALTLLSATVSLLILPLGVTQRNYTCTVFLMIDYCCGSLHVCSVCAYVH